MARELLQRTARDPRPSAWINRTLPTPGQTVIGQSSSAPGGAPADAFAITKAPDGTCLSTSLSTTPPQVGLDDATIITAAVVGNASSSISFATGAQQFCGFSLQPLITNGYFVSVIGGPGNDTLYNANISGVFIDGQGGHDGIVNFTSNQGRFSFGGDGNDRFYCDAGDYAYGGSGNDVFCTYSGWPAVYDGASGNDSYCGNVQYAYDATQLPPNCSCL